jgi:hypothetical protein
MKRLIPIVFLLMTILSCATIGAMRTWTVQETKDWYKEYYVNQPNQPRPFVSQIYYRGSNDKYHYFISRYMDEWVFMKIKVEELTIGDVRPEWTSSSKSDSAGLFGYYPVDPLDNFKKVQPLNKTG